QEPGARKSVVTPGSLLGSSKKMALGVAPWVEEGLRWGFYLLLIGYHNPWLEILFGLTNGIYIAAHYWRNRKDFVERYKAKHSGQELTNDKVIFGTLLAPLVVTMMSLLWRPLFAEAPWWVYPLANAAMHFGINALTFVINIAGGFLLEPASLADDIRRRL